MDGAGNLIRRGGFPFFATLEDDEVQYHLSCFDNRDGTCTVEYCSSRVGLYKVDDLDLVCCYFLGYCVSLVIVSLGIISLGIVSLGIISLVIYFIGYYFLGYYFLGYYFLGYYFLGYYFIGYCFLV